MSETRKPALPQQGGSYIRQANGALKDAREKAQRTSKPPRAPNRSIPPAQDAEEAK